MKILICQLRNHGDIIRAFPLIEALKETYDGCEVDFTCLDTMVETCIVCDVIDAVVPQPRLETITNSLNNSRVCDVSILEAVVSAIRLKKYDVYIDLHGIFQSALIGLLANIPVRIGRSYHTAKDGAHLMYTHICDIESWDINKMERNIMVAKTYFKKLEFTKINNLKWHMHNTIAILPGSSEIGILKRWHLKKYIELANQLSQNYKVLFILGPEEVDIKKSLAKYSYENIFVSSFQAYKDLFSRCRGVIGNDSAALHLSIWQQIPTFMICGPTKGVINGVWSYAFGATIEKEEKCLACNVWSGQCKHQFECLETLEVRTVYQVIIDMLGAGNEKTDGLSKNKF